MGHNAFTIRQLAEELAIIAHARALHAVHPILRLGAPQHRDVVYRALAEEFEDLASSVEAMLRRSEIVRPRNATTAPHEGGRRQEPTRHGRDAALAT